jgi:mono/diheme cytochrome c family protein
MKRLLVVGIVIIVIIGAFLIYIYSGSYNISAMVPHNGLTRWIISTVTDNSVEHHAKDIKAPNLMDSSMIQTGFNHYRRMCVGCHGAPGRDQGEMAKSYYPKPPLLVYAVKDWNPSELFWIVKNGIKMTAMPAFGRTHSDNEIWAITAFLQKLPDMTKEQFQELNEAANRERNEAMNRK